MKTKGGVGISIGVSKEGVNELKLAIMGILNCDSDESTKVVALEILRTGCQVTNTHITNCNIKTL